MYDGRYFLYSGGYSVQWRDGEISSERWRDIISTMKRYYKYLWRDTVSNRRILSAFEGYHQYIRQIPSVRWRESSTLEHPPLTVLKICPHISLYRTDSIPPLC